MLVIHSLGETIQIPNDYERITYRNLYDSPDVLTETEKVLCLPLFFDWSEHIVRPDSRSLPPVGQVLKQYVTLGGIAVVVFPHRSWKIRFSEEHREAYKIPKNADGFTSGKDGTRSLVRSLTGCFVSMKSMYLSASIEARLSSLKPYLEDYISSFGSSLRERPYFSVREGKCQKIGWWGNEEYPFALASSVGKGCVVILAGIQGGGFTDETMKAVEQLAHRVPGELEKLSKSRALRKGKRRRRRGDDGLVEMRVAKFNQRTFASCVGRSERTIRYWLKNEGVAELWNQFKQMDYRLMLAMFVAWRRLDGGKRDTALLRLKDVAEKANIWGEVKERMKEAQEIPNLRYIFDRTLLSRFGIRNSGLPLSASES